MADIKTRDVLKGTVRTIDKVAVAGQRMKHAYIATKEKAEHSVEARETSTEEYAADRFEAGTDTALHEGAYTLDKAGRKGVQTTRENIIKTKDGMERFKQKRAEQSLRKQASQSASQQPVSATGRQTTDTGARASKIKRQTAQAGKSSIKTVPQTGKTVKQSVTSAGKKTIKTFGRGTAKTAQKTVKTAEQTSKAAIKTAQQSAKAAQKTAQATMKASQKAAQAAKTAAKATARGAKAAVKAVITTVKAILAATKALIAAIAAGGWIAVVIILIIVLLGSALTLFGGGGSSNSYTPVSAEVEAYEPLIQKYAKQYGIPEYVELLKAMMMQESGGRGLDPMQAAEGSFNTRYPHEPNGIQDPEYSIQCGVQELKAALFSAEVKNPIDMERIKLALQGYNFGNGYISWAKNNYGGYSYANAVEFSTMQAKRLGWERYGDTQYPAHVLRYYPYGRAFTSGGNQAIVVVALTQLGNEGGQPYWSWYGFDSRVEWCGCFVSWCADQCGYIEDGIIPKYAGCDDGVQWFRSRGQWLDGSEEPMPGMIIFFDWDNKGSSGPQDGESDHTGIVEKVENGIVYTVEGDSGDSCRQRQYAVGHYEIFGYGTPQY